LPKNNIFLAHNELKEIFFTAKPNPGTSNIKLVSPY